MFLITKYSWPMKIFTTTAKTMNVVASLCKLKILLMNPGLKIQILEFVSILKVKYKFIKFVQVSG